MVENPQTFQGNDLPGQEADLEKKRNRSDFWLGLIGSIVGNLLAAGASFLIILNLPAIDAALTKQLGKSLTDSLMSVGAVLAQGLPWVLNIAAIVLVLVKRRPQIALGILVSYALAFALALIAGIILMVVCFTSYN